MTKAEIARLGLIGQAPGVESLAPQHAAHTVHLEPIPLLVAKRIELSHDGIDVDLADAGSSCHHFLTHSGSGFQESPSLVISRAL